MRPATRRRLLLATGIGALGAGLVAVRTRRAPGASSGAPVAASTRAARSAHLARVAGRTGGAYGIHRARRAFASAERRDELDTQFQLRTAEEVAAALGNLKGALMKVGQMASYLDQGLPQPVRDVLAQLQSDAPPMTGELATSTLEAELGRSVEELFLEWDPVPIASASIGQVHRAITADGRAVAVKVQYPGVAAAMTSDLENADLIFNAMRLMFPNLDPKPLVEELKTRLLEELDYRTEASNQALFADYYRDHPFIHVPDVDWSLSTERILTSDLAEGRPFSELLTWPPGVRQRAAEAVYRYVVRSLYCLHAFNGDPHPGNYLFQPDGRVTFLDYGLVKRFDESEIELFRGMHQTMVERSDPAAYRALVEGAGLIRPSPDVSDERIAEYFGGLYAHLIEDEPTALTHEFASDLVARILDTSGPYADVQKLANVPPSFVVVQRINLGLYSILADLGAVANWRAITQEIVPWDDQPPATELGLLERAWLDRTAAPSPAPTPVP